MAKYTNSVPKDKPPVAKGPVKTRKVATTRTHEGGDAFEYTPKSELFSLAVVNMMGENTFYESAKDRDSRFVSLIHKVAAKDPAWIAAFIPFLRNEMNMRSASVVMAAEFVAATKGGPGVPEVVASALVRADEPAEILGYWMSRYGRNVPRAIKRGIEIAANNWTPYSAMKYDGQGNGIRLGDVINLAHPRAKTPEQSILFKYLLDRRFGNEQDAYGVEMLDNALDFGRKTDAERRAMSADELKAAGITWERLSSTGAMDAAMWEKVIPSMGYMALLRNLRNFEQAGISKSAISRVAERLADPEQVERSRQFPFRFLSAYREVTNDKFRCALADALDVSIGNLPDLPGRTLVLVDVSASMNNRLSAKSQVARREVGLLFGAALATRNAKSADLVAFGTSSTPVPVAPGGSILRVAESGHELAYRVGHGTNTWQAAQARFNGHDRIVVFTDEQSTRFDGSPPKATFIYNFNLAGYGRSDLDLRKSGRYELNGFTDTMAKMIPLLERGESQTWPWESV